MKRLLVLIVSLVLFTFTLAPFLPHDHGLHAPHATPFCNQCSLLKTLPLEMPHVLIIAHYWGEQFTDFHFSPALLYGNASDSTESRAPPRLT